MWPAIEPAIRACGKHLAGDASVKEIAAKIFSVTKRTGIKLDKVLMVVLENRRDR